MSILEACQWLESTAIGIYVRESQYGFPMIAGTHIVALTLSVGTLLWFDLRLLGVAWRGYRVSHVYRQLIRWALPGFLLMFGTGGLLFTAFATKAIGNVYFRIKLAAMIVAAVNALFFHVATERGLAGWDASSTPPRAARAAGFIAILAWSSVIAAGRMMSYTMF
jgi:hypothetical protein